MVSDEALNAKSEMAARTESTSESPQTTPAPPATDASAATPTPADTETPAAATVDVVIKMSPQQLADQLKGFAANAGEEMSEEAKQALIKMAPKLQDAINDLQDKNSTAMDKAIESGDIKEIKRLNEQGKMLEQGEELLQKQMKTVNGQSAGQAQGADTSQGADGEEKGKKEEEEKQKVTGGQSKDPWMQIIALLVKALTGEDILGADQQVAASPAAGQTRQEPAAAAPATPEAPATATPPAAAAAPDATKAPTETPAAKTDAPAAAAPATPEAPATATPPAAAAAPTATTEPPTPPAPPTTAAPTPTAAATTEAPTPPAPPTTAAPTPAAATTAPANNETELKDLAKAKEELARAMATRAGAKDGQPHDPKDFEKDVDAVAGKAMNGGSLKNEIEALGKEKEKLTTETGYVDAYVGAARDKALAQGRTGDGLENEVSMARGTANASIGNDAALQNMKQERDAVKDLVESAKALAKAEGKSESEQATAGEMAGKNSAGKSMDSIAGDMTANKDRAKLINDSVDIYAKQLGLAGTTADDKDLIPRRQSLAQDSNDYIDAGMTADKEKNAALTALRDKETERGEFLGKNGLLPEGLSKEQYVGAIMAEAGKRSTTEIQGATTEATSELKTAQDEMLSINRRKDTIKNDENSLNNDVQNGTDPTARTDLMAKNSALNEDAIKKLVAAAGGMEAFKFDVAGVGKPRSQEFSAGNLGTGTEVPMAGGSSGKERSATV